MDFEIEDDDNFRSSWSMPKKKSMFSGFGVDADTDGYDYDFGVGDNKPILGDYDKSTKERDKSKGKTSSSSTIESSKQKVANKSADNGGGNAMSALEKAQSMLNKYSSKLQVKKAPAVVKYSEAFFDEDDISIESDSEPVVVSQAKSNDPKVSTNERTVTGTKLSKTYDLENSDDSDLESDNFEDDLSVSGYHNETNSQSKLQTNRSTIIPSAQPNSNLVSKTVFQATSALREMEPEEYSFDNSYSKDNFEALDTENPLMEGNLRSNYMTNNRRMERSVDLESPEDTITDEVDDDDAGNERDDAIAKPLAKVFSFSDLQAATGWAENDVADVAEESEDSHESDNYSESENYDTESSTHNIHNKTDVNDNILKHISDSPMERKENDASIANQKPIESLSSTQSRLAYGKPEEISRSPILERKDNKNNLIVTARTTEGHSSTLSNNLSKGPTTTLHDDNNFADVHNASNTALQHQRILYPATTTDTSHLPHNVHKTQQHQESVNLSGAQLNYHGPQQVPSQVHTQQLPSNNNISYPENSHPNANLLPNFANSYLGGQQPPSTHPGANYHHPSQQYFQNSYQAWAAPPGPGPQGYVNQSYPGAYFPPPPPPPPMNAYFPYYPSYGSVHTPSLPPPPGYPYAMQPNGSLPQYQSTYGYMNNPFALRASINPSCVEPSTDPNSSAVLMAQILRELQTVKEESAFTMKKLADVIMEVHRSNQSQERVSNNSTTSDNNTDATSIKLKNQSKQKASNGSAKAHVTEKATSDDMDEDYSNDAFDEESILNSSMKFQPHSVEMSSHQNSKGNVTSPRCSTTILPSNNPLQDSREFNWNINPISTKVDRAVPDRFTSRRSSSDSSRNSFDNILLTSQALFRDQLATLRHRLDAVNSSNPISSMHTTGILDALKTDLKSEKKSSENKLRCALLQVDPSLSEADLSRLIAKYA